jgi:hypothetical protein
MNEIIRVRAVYCGSLVARLALAETAAGVRPESL